MKVWVFEYSENGESYEVFALYEIEPTEQMLIDCIYKKLHYKVKQEDLRNWGRLYEMEVQ
jgi:hypothetical protein